MAAVLFIGTATTLGVAANAGAAENVQKVPAGPLPGERAYMIVGSKRFLSGPYGNAVTIGKVVATVKQHGHADEISSRNLQLPNQPPYMTLDEYQYRFPIRCGGHRFRVFQGQGTQILEYDYPDPNGGIVRIRDYIVGPGPFVSAGLWGPYDHTADTSLDMALLPGRSDKDGMGLMKGTYEIGWVTTLPEWRQAQLGIAYERALNAAQPCLK